MTFETVRLLQIFCGPFLETRGFLPKVYEIFTRPSESINHISLFSWLANHESLNKISQRKEQELIMVNSMVKLLFAIATYLNLPFTL